MFVGSTQKLFADSCDATKGRYRINNNLKQGRFFDENIINEKVCVVTQDFLVLMYN
jgi:hypothetical protein